MSAPAGADPVEGDDRRPAPSGERDQKRRRLQYAGTDCDSPKFKLRWTVVRDGATPEENPQSDFRIQVGDSVYHCHSLLLRRESSFFDKVATWASNGSEGAGNPMDGERSRFYIANSGQTSASNKTSTSSTSASSSGSETISGDQKDADKQEQKSSSSEGIDDGGKNEQKVGGTVSSGDINNAAEADKAGGTKLKFNFNHSNDNHTSSPQNKPGAFFSNITELLPAPCLEDPSTFEKTLSFIYSQTRDSFKIPVDGVVLLLKCADVLGMRGFFEICAAVVGHYAPVYAPLILTECEKCCLPDCDPVLNDVREICIPEVVEFFQAFANRKEMLPLLHRLPLSVQTRVLSDRELGVEDEDVVLEYSKKSIRRESMIPIRNSNSNSHVNQNND
jgi:hypothetical protein